jgi:uncharacterized protein involved in outer membrane biogenesis
MTWNVRKILLGTAISLAILLACLGLGLIPLNLFFLKATITEAVRDHSGAELAVEGPLRLRLGPRPKLTARKVTLRWPDETRPLSTYIEELSIQTRMASVLRGDIDLTRATADGIVIDPGAEELRDKLPENLRLKASAPLNEALKAELEGPLANQTWTLSLQGASLDTLLAAKQEYPLKAGLSLPGSGLDFDGVILLPWTAPTIDGQLVLQSTDLSALLLQLDQDLPGLGELSLQSGIQLRESSVQLDGLRVELDDFSFKGSAQVRDWSSRPWFDFRASIPLIDPANLPGIDRDKKPSKPESPLDLQPLFDLLAGFDGQAEIEVGQVHHTDFPIRDLAVSANMDAGRLAIKEATASISGVDVSAQASLDTSAACARLETSLRIPELDQVALYPLLENDTSIKGRLVDGRFTTSSCGASPGDHLQSLETAFMIASLELSGADDDSLVFNNIDGAVSWQQSGRLAFDSELIGEVLTFSAQFGSVVQMTSDELWPVALQAHTDSLKLEFSGQTAAHETGLILDLSLAAQAGTSDISGELAWSGFDSGLPLKADFRSRLLNLRELEALLVNGDQEEPGSIKDWSDILDESELIEHWHAAPSIDVKLAVDQLEGTRYEIGRIGLDAHLEERRVTDGRMHVTFEGVELEGLLNADMSQHTVLFDYQVSLKNLDIGRLMKSLEISETVNARVERADIHLESQGATLRELGRNMQLDFDLLSLQYSFEAGPENRPFDINLSDVSIIARPDSDMVWESRGTLNGFPLSAWLRTPNLRETFDEKLPLPVRFILKSRDDILMFDLIRHPKSASGRLTEVLISGRYTGEDDIDFASLPSPLEDYFFSTDLTIKDKVYLASDIDIRMGSSNATGKFSIQPSGEGFHFELDSESTFLETDDLVRWIQEFREAREAISGTQSASPETANPEAHNADEAPMSVGLLTLANQYAEEFIGDNSWDARVTIRELRSSGNLLGDAKFRLQLDGHEIILDPATISLPEGNVAARYSSIGDGSGWDSNLDVFIERLEYGGLLRLFNPESAASGEIFVDASLHSRAVSHETAVNHLEGTVDLAVFPDDIGAGFLDLWASNLVFALLPAGDNAEKKMNCMVARFEVENGVMKSKQTFLDSTDIIVRARGDIDLANRQLDILAAPQAKVEKFLSVSSPIQVKGPFDDFKVRVAPGSFVITMLRWYYGLIYVPWKWLTGERFPADGIATCYKAMDWELPTEAR